MSVIDSDWLPFCKWWLLQFCKNTVQCKYMYHFSEAKTTPSFTWIDYLIADVGGESRDRDRDHCLFLLRHLMGSGVLGSITWSNIQLSCSCLLHFIIRRSADHIHRRGETRPALSSHDIIGEAEGSCSDCLSAVTQQVLDVKSSNQ